MEVCKEKNYIARNCKRNKFARIVAAVCPKAGEAKKIVSMRVSTSADKVRVRPI